MHRRKALSLTATILGSALVGSEMFLTGCSSPIKTNRAFTPEDVALLDQVGETILPTSSQSPGAKAAHIGAFMKTMVTDCYTEEEHQIFIEGLNEIDKTSNKKYGADFLSISNEQRHQLLSQFNQEARKKSGNKPHFFSMMKELTIWGYFTSEPGATEALRYNPIPGRFDGCLSYNNENAWA